MDSDTDVRNGGDSTGPQRAAPLLTRLRHSEAVNGWLLISPTALYALLLLAAPLVTLFTFSFFKDGYLTIIPEFTLENYQATLSDPIFAALMQRSLWVSGLVTLATVLTAFPIAYYLSFHVAPALKARWLFLITIPFWTSYLIRVFLWKVILGYNGVVNSGLKELGLIDKPLEFLLYNVNSIVLTLSHSYAPFAILPIYVALEKIDRALLEAGQDLGESRLMTFWRVTLPLAMPGVIAAVLIVFIPTIGDYVTPQLIGGGKIPMVANLIQARMLDMDNKPLGSAVAVISMAIVAVVSILFLALNRRFLRGQK
ncbi:ABC-type spermidine/putrescine transport system permease subunit I [Phaeovulum vinaykumarii]|uniref:Spermidine/putrescine transport system permease protein n=1 Tax=Phaeovulum vinaykumarii TaxID=407234 RepID=A0A1N7MU48_9RHOB|nr:spermidine/putrescine transport system permease protein [Phaeovulum vinaykumarii]SOC18345.1 ABC-type spermidine/putrescine transport system permease subunit I [Phaeovulum vinaykumarii]